MTSQPPPSDTLTYVKAGCHCGLNTFRAGFLTSSLPISNDLCHCSSCRTSSGQMAVYHVNVANLLCEDTDDPFHLDGDHGDGDLVAYHTSPDGIRYFCSACSAHIIFQYLGKPKDNGSQEREGGFVRVAAGALERTDGIVKIGYHIWVEDTLDGGLANHLRKVDEVSLPRYSREVDSTQLPIKWRDPSLPQQSSKDRLHFHCHCRAIQFSITRPTSMSFAPRAPYPDLLRPHDTVHLARLRNSEDAKWWLYPTGSPQPTKYLAGHCVCSHCRLTSGFEIQSWVWVPADNIRGQDGRPVVLESPSEDEQMAFPSTGVSRQDVGQRMKGLKQYLTSPGRNREFCATCGATVFAWLTGNPELICVSVALVDQDQDGARADSWLEWCLDRVAFGEEPHSQSTVGGLKSGLRETKEERNSAGEDHPSNFGELTLKSNGKHRRQEDFSKVVDEVKA